MEPTTGKRIVSKGAYVVARGAKISLHSLGTFLTILTLLTGFLFSAWLFYHPTFTLLTGCAVFGLVLSGGVVMDRVAKKIAQASASIDPGVPLTRANVADLPAPDSLVRASEQPQQAQEAVLLRAAAQGQETPQEQLVRASVRQE